MIRVYLLLPVQSQLSLVASYIKLVDHTQRRTTVGRSPLDECSTRRRDGRVFNSSQRPLPENTQHSQQTNVHAPGGIRTHDLSR